MQASLRGAFRVAARRLSSQRAKPDLFTAQDQFIPRHIGPTDAESARMLKVIGCSSLDDLVHKTVPADIRLNRAMDFGEFTQPKGEQEALAHMKDVAGKNHIARNFIGMGYHDTFTPAVILRNVIENPGWYTQYTPYQPEVAQGRLESLMNFQTLISGLTGLELCNASLLDEGTAAAEAMAMCHGLATKRGKFFVDKRVHPQTIAVVQCRADGFKIELVVGDFATATLDDSYSGCLLQYPATDGAVLDYKSFIAQAKSVGAKAAVSADPLSLMLLESPASIGADIAVGSAQRFGVPLGYGGPHAGFLSTSNSLARKMPGRIIGLSIDAENKPAYRLTMQTREQHIRRDKATSNVCTAQALLANVAAMYALYHGPEGLKEIALRTHMSASLLGAGLTKLGFEVNGGVVFDTITIKTPKADAIQATGHAALINFRHTTPGELTLACDETTTPADIERVWAVFAGKPVPFSAREVLAALPNSGDAISTSPFARLDKPITHPIFSQHRSEHQLLRYMMKLQSRDLSLAHTMMPLGSCTMKLNATAEMIPITWPEINSLHPYAPLSQTKGYLEMFKNLEMILSEVTGFDSVSLQPNSGAMGEYSGLRAIRAFQAASGEGHRDVCIIPVSAHGTNPASAVMCGLRVVPIGCDEHGNIDIADLRAKAEKHKDKLSSLMVTYPSTHGVFEEGIKEICQIVHDYGGNVYMDGANMNAQVGLCRPGDFGADVCHLNLHKTFCIPHGGGGPGVGPIGVKAHLAPFLPGNPLIKEGSDGLGKEHAFGAVAAAPWGSASILPISYMYCIMMGASGLKKATEIAILNANYMAKRLEAHYEVLFTGKDGMCAHEFILDLRSIKAATGISESDVAKRLADYGFHAPTMSWPVSGTIMVEPTESEDLQELNRYCDALISIRKEIKEVEDGVFTPENNVLKNAPHPMSVISADVWKYPYTREQAGYPMPHLRGNKFWPTTARLNDVYGDRNLVCTCPPMEDFIDDEDKMASN
ncbi:glycine dehydrogenase [Pavlovales sp. CCMP2436]|nr:glycine dehydrogenase [Pavlovales sp. CCMP2436]